MRTSVFDRFGLLDPFKIFSGNSNLDLFHKISDYLGFANLGDIVVDRFSDGEIKIEIFESIEGVDVFILQSTCFPVNDNLMELLFIVDALKRASASSITAVVPYFGYARQDGKIDSRAPISAKLVADMISLSGVDSLITMDLHASQIRGFFNIPVYNLSFLPLVYKYIKNNFDSSEIVIVSPDAGGFNQAVKLSNLLGCGMAFINKFRSSPNEATAFSLVGNVKNKIVVIQDDMIDTAGTLSEAVKIINELGAISINVFCTHPILSGPSLERIANSSIDKLIVADTIPLNKKKLNIDKIEVLSVAEILGEAMARSFTRESIDSLFV